MATSELAPSHPDLLLRERSPAARIVGQENILLLALSVLASLRLTVVLFSLAIFLVFVGTLAQKDNDVWRVVNDTYFRVWVAEVRLQTFERLAQMFFKGVDWQLSGWFPFPGGKTIGLLLLANLVAAHAVRFKVAASGVRLILGLAVIALGVLLTALVIQTGMDQAVVSELAPAFANKLWNILRASLAGLAFTGAYILMVGFGKRRSFVWWMLLTVDLLVGALAVWLLMNPELRLDNSGLRILWQLIQGTAAGGVLLAGCVLVFRKRAGIVLLHGGVALLMLAELWTAMTANESQMTIPEGSYANFSSDIRTSELAVINGAHAGHDHVTVVPQSLLVGNVGKDSKIEHPDLPVAVRVVRWLPNAAVRDATAKDPNPATAGFGKQQVPDELPQTTGVGEDSDKIDQPSAYVELYSPKSGDLLGTYLVSAEYNNQPIEVDGHNYELALRFKRIYYPYTIALKDFRFDKYTGTQTAKNYSSLVELDDPARKVRREVLVSMNNPLRYASDTFYQSSFDQFTEKATVLQVVRNPGWMTPYVACMLVATGMLAHFGVILVRFLRRRAEEEALVSPLQRAGVSSAWTMKTVWFPALVVAIFGLYLASKARMPRTPPNEMQIYDFAELPLAYQGRIKPYDTLARNMLQILSGRQEMIIVDKNREVIRREPAIRWLLDTISGKESALDAPVFRIESLDLLDTLGLEFREGALRYSWNEINSKPGEMQRQIDLLKGIEETDRNLYQSKVAELATKLNLFLLLKASFAPPPLSSEPDQVAASLQRTQQMIASLRESQSPHAVPPTTASTEWLPLMEAELKAMLDEVTKKPVNPATITLKSLLDAYRDEDARTFNTQLTNYQQILGSYEQMLTANEQQMKSAGVHQAEILSQPKVDFEVYYNQFSPFYWAAVLYVVAFVLGVLSWVGWTEPLRRASMWLLVMTFALHTFALVARVYISGRPPVTNLYSATVFVGWGGVLLSLIFEQVYRLGLGNITAAVIGFLTLLVANFLSLDGDTFLVLQAVLDTQFWLATHVVTINLGYAATIAAGLWGAIYILMAHVVPVLDENARRQVIRITYGTLCFAIFFSFVGTVLGGLWADDSWGRFWGWDPKENGALIIVLYNALVLHARWGGLVKNRGFATLAVGGNVAVAWSGFGVNEFGVGLHAYGASESSTAMWLLTFAISQLALMALGAMPAEWFDRFGAPRSKQSIQ